MGEGKWVSTAVDDVGYQWGPQDTWYWIMTGSSIFDYVRSCLASRDFREPLALRRSGDGLVILQFGDAHDRYSREGV